MLIYGAVLLRHFALFLFLLSFQIIRNTIIYCKIINYIRDILYLDVGRQHIIFDALLHAFNASL